MSCYAKPPSKQFCFHKMGRINVIDIYLKTNKDIQVLKIKPNYTVHKAEFNPIIASSCHQFSPDYKVT
jgi:hypothetical protein